jgi:integrative and conjugative element protein (TIGR02256 family)
VIDSVRWAAGQRLAVEQLEALATSASGAVEVLGVHPTARPGVIRIDVSVDLQRPPSGPGIRVRARERFEFHVSDLFPFTPPSVWVPHRRWAGTPHVQWGRSLCLYQAPSTEWVPGDGLRGLIDRLLLWLERAAAGTLDSDGVAMHPPIAYADNTAGTLIVRADLGDLVPWRGDGDGRPTRLVALGIQQDDRLDVVRWMPVDDYVVQVLEGGRIQHHDEQPLVAAPAVLLNADLGAEYPDNGADLLAALAQQGAGQTDVLLLMALVTQGNVLSAAVRGVPAPEGSAAWPVGPGGVPQILLVGTPSRQVGSAPRAAHLVGWRLDDFTGRTTELHGSMLGSRWDNAPGDLREEVDHLRQRVSQLGAEHLQSVNVRWLHLLEDRPEVTRRRDHDTSAAWLRGKRILILGCGALGAPIAEAVVRAGAADVTVVDNGIVTPGLLVRQPYSDADIGRAKATVLAERLRQARAGACVHARPTNAIDLIRGLPAPVSDTFDLVIDATADVGVRAALERHRAAADGTWPPLLTLLVGHRARRGIVTISRPDASGGGSDILRRLGIAARTSRARQLADVASDLYPTSPRTDPFLPEPGCSAPTFTGSQIEAAALAAGLFGAGLDALTGRLRGSSTRPMAAAAIRLEHTDTGPAGQAGTTWLSWPNDLVVPTVDGALQVRISQPALGTIWAETRRGLRLRGPGIETGGMLLGCLDEATGVVHIDVATAPSPDSRCSAVHFQHGVEGTQEIVDHHCSRTGGLTMFVGMWHTHPGGAARPSPTDEAGMANLVTPVLGGPPRSLMLIVGGPTPAWGAWRDRPTLDNTKPPQLYARIVRRADRNAPPPPQPPPPPGRYYLAGATDDERPRRPWWLWWRSSS